MEDNTFTIDERFEFLDNYIKLVINGQMNSLIINGTTGIGKSHTVLQHLTNTDKKYFIVKGFSTARALYDALYHNRNSIIIFDDCDNILADKVAVNILKGALDTYDERVISWLSKSTDKNIPLQFNFQGQVIFISNLKTEQFDEAMKSRALMIDLSMTYEEKQERMLNIYSLIKPEVSSHISYEVLMELFRTIENEEDLNLRTYEKALVLYMNNSENFDKQLKFMLMT